MSASSSVAQQPDFGSIAAWAKKPALRSRQVAVDLVAALDAGAVVIGAVLPAWIYAEAGGLDTNWMVIAQTALVTALIHCACMRSWRMYDTMGLHDFPVSPGRLLAALLIAMLASLGLGMPFKMADVHLWVWYVAWIAASFTAILGVRIVARSVLARLTSIGHFDTRVAVFGAGEIARRVQGHLADGAAGIHFAGVYDDRPQDRLDSEGLDVRGTLDDLIRKGRSGAIDQIVIALPQAADQRTSMIAAKLEQLSVSIHVVSHIASDLVKAGPAHKVSAIGSVGLLDVKHRPLDDWDPIVKRVEDIVLGGILLALALPAMALIALAIKLESKGPVLFRQRRGGRNLNVIEVFKFRTMRVMEDGAKIEQARANDSRVTAVGRLLRRSSLDELPQLFNVVRGDMSLVGPRPHAIAHDEQWGEMLAAYPIRHQVKPGITGLAQVNGWRGEINSTGDIEARVRQDLDYIRNWSIGLDLAILARTIGAVLCAKNAH